MKAHKVKQVTPSLQSNCPPSSSSHTQPDNTLVRKASSLSDIRKNFHRPHDLNTERRQQQQFEMNRETPSHQATSSIEELGTAILELARDSSITSVSSSTTTDSVERRSTATEPRPTLSERRETLTMRQIVPTIIGLRDPIQCFKVKDDTSHRRYKVLFPGDPPDHNAPDFLVIDNSGMPVWSIRPSPASTTKVLFKPGSDYHILLRRKHWVPYLNRLVEGLAYRHGREKLVLVVKGDALGRRFWIYADKNLIAQAHRTTHIAQLGKNVKLTVAHLASANFTIANWTFSVEPHVDTALMTAIVTVLEKWTIDSRYTDRRTIAESMLYGNQPTAASQRSTSRHKSERPVAQTEPGHSRRQ